jgi:3-hydroxybutyryl-CoA dehydrogenase
VTTIAGLPTVVVARGPGKVDRVIATVGKSVERAALKGRIGKQHAVQALDLLTTATDVDALDDCDLVIEAVAEDLAVKRPLFARLGVICKPDAVLATTTSSLSVAACAEAAGRPGDVIGMHFFNPARAMELVEIVHTPLNNPDVLATAHAVCTRLGKTGIRCADRPGFVVNFLLFPYLADAVKMLGRDMDITEVDDAVRLGFGYPMGPFTLLDTIGLDVSLAIMRLLYSAFGGAFAPPPVLADMVALGRLGRKSGRGFHNHKARAAASSS